MNKKDERAIQFVKENFILQRNSRSNDRFVWNIKVSVSEYYIDNLSEETKKGQKEKVLQEWLPGKPPTVYKTQLQDNRTIHTPDENVAPLIRKIFKMYATQEYSIISLKNKIQEEYTKIVGKKLSKTKLAGILNNKYYMGKIQCAKKNIAR